MGDILKNFNKIVWPPGFDKKLRIFKPQSKNKEQLHIWFNCFLYCAWWQWYGMPTVLSCYSFRKFKSWNFWQFFKNDQVKHLLSNPFQAHWNTGSVPKQVNDKVSGIKTCKFGTGTTKNDYNNIHNEIVEKYQESPKKWCFSSKSPRGKN